MSTRVASRLSGLLLALALTACASHTPPPRLSSLPTPDEVLTGLRDFYKQTARPDGSFRNGIDPNYLGMSDSAYSDLAAVTYAVTVHKTFGWTLPDEKKTIEFILSRQRPTGEFFNVAGTVDPNGVEGKVYNTTQALVALRALGVKPTHDPLPVFEEILKADYKTLPAFSTSFFPLAYLCYGKSIPEKADRGIRALMVQDETGYMNNHIAATFHASHYYRLVGEATPKAEQMVTRTLRDQAQDGSWLLNMPSRDRHATFDAVFVLHQEGAGRNDCKRAIQRAAEWALSCRNEDGGFGHYPGSPSDADANYFQVGTLAMAGFLKPVDPLPANPELLSWGHTMPLRKTGEIDYSTAPFPFGFLSKARPGETPEIWSMRCDQWVGALAFSPDSKSLLIGSGGQETFGAGVVDATCGVFRKPVNGLVPPVTAVCFSRDGRLAAAGAYDHMLVVQGDEGVSPMTVDHGSAVLAATFAQNDKVILTGGFDGLIQVWPVQLGRVEKAPKPITTLRGHRSWVNAMTVMPDGRLVSGSSDGTVKIWSLTTMTCEKTLVATNAEVRSVAVSPDGKWLVAGMRYGPVKVWDTATWTEKYSFKAHDADVFAVAFDADSKSFLTGNGDWNRGGQVKRWSIETGAQTGKFEHTGEVLSIAVSPDGQLIAAGGGDGTVRVWKAK